MDATSSVLISTSRLILKVLKYNELLLLLRYLSFIVLIISVPINFETHSSRFNPNFICDIVLQTKDK
jgi:hypothetical protein